MTHCDYCKAVIPNKNKQFCNKDCMVSFMRQRNCMGCRQRFDIEEIGQWFCSQKCKDSRERSSFLWNLTCMLGHGYRNEEIIDLHYKVKDRETHEIKEYKIDFKEDLK